MLCFCLVRVGELVWVNNATCFRVFYLQKKTWHPSVVLDSLIYIRKEFGVGLMIFTEVKVGGSKIWVQYMHLA